MHDEQPFCQSLTERRRTTVRFLGQQSEVTIDDTCPQAGEMRNLWKGITEFWTDDMPQDATWRPNRHHSNINPLFRNHVTQNAVGMFPPPPNPVISIEHGYRDSRLSAVPHTEDAEEKGRRVVLEVSELSNVYNSPPLRIPQTLKTLLLKQQTQAVNDRIPAKGCRQLLVKPWAKWHGKGNHACQLCGATTNDKGEITGTSKAIQRRLMTAEMTPCTTGRWVEVLNWTSCKTRSTKPTDCGRKSIWKKSRPRRWCWVSSGVQTTGALMCVSICSCPSDQTHGLGPRSARKGGIGKSF